MGKKKLRVRHCWDTGDVEHKGQERYKGVKKQPSGLESTGVELWAGEDQRIREWEQHKLIYQRVPPP